MLARINPHARDSDIVFDPVPHSYLYKPTGVYMVSPSTKVKDFIPDTFDPDQAISIMGAAKRQRDYPGMTDQEIKQAWKKNSQDR